MSSVSQIFEEHPLAIAGAIAVVAVLAYVSSRNQPATTTSTEYGFAGGGQAAPIDPNAAAIEEAAITAGSRGVSTIASLLGLEDTNNANLTASLAGTTAAAQVAETQSANALAASLAQTQAQRDTSLAETAAQQEVIDQQTQAGLTLGTAQTAAQVQQAQIAATTQQAQIAAQQAAAVRASNNAAAAQKAQNKSNTTQEIISGVVKLGTAALAFFGL